MTTTRRTLILAVLLVAAGSLIFATGAAVIDGEADTLADDRVAIQPVDGPNGDYARLNEGEIIVDVSPTNPNLSADFEGSTSARPAGSATCSRSPTPPTRRRTSGSNTGTRT